MTKAHREAISRALSGRPKGPVSRQTRKVMSLAQRKRFMSKKERKKVGRKGHRSWSQGKVLSLETRIKMSRSAVGHRVVSVTRRKISAGLKKHKRTASHCNSLSRAAITKTMSGASVSNLELKVRRALKLEGLTFVVQAKVFGRPDILIEPMIAVFVDGDYWHNSKKAAVRDQQVVQVLEDQGYEVVRLSERKIRCDLSECVRHVLDVVDRVRAGVAA